MKYVLPGLGNWINTRNVLDGIADGTYRLSSLSASPDSVWIAKTVRLLNQPRKNANSVAPAIKKGE